MTAKYCGNTGCPQKDSTECKEYVGAPNVNPRDRKERTDAHLLERILQRDNLNRAYLQVERNHGAPGIDGMTVEEALPWLKEHKEDLLESLRNGSYKPSPVRRKDIPKPDGGTRQLGIPTVIDRIIQQAIAQILIPIYEPQFSDASYGYRPGRSAKEAIRKVKKYAEEGYTHAVQVDLSKYFDTINHDLLLNLLRQAVKDGRVIKLIKKYLKSGIMADGVIVRTEQGTSQGGPLSPLLANIYLNEFDQEWKRRGMKHIRYADDIIILTKSKRAAEHQLESSRKYLEGKLKLTMNTEKSKVVSVFAIKRFKFLGFCIGKNGNGIYIRAHKKSLNKAKQKLRAITKRNRGRNVRTIMAEIAQYMKGWLGYYYIADMKRTLKSWDEWLRRRIRMYIWKQWKKARTRVKNLRKLGISKDQAYQWGNTRLGYWRVAGSPVLKCSITNEKLAQAGYMNTLQMYEQIRRKHLND